MKRILLIGGVLVCILALGGLAVVASLPLAPPVQQIRQPVAVGGK